MLIRSISFITKTCYKQCAPTEQNIFRNYLPGLYIMLLMNPFYANCSFGAKYFRNYPGVPYIIHLMKTFYSNCSGGAHCFYKNYNRPNRLHRSLLLRWPNELAQFWWSYVANKQFENQATIRMHLRSISFITKTCYKQCAPTERNITFEICVTEDAPKTKLFSNFSSSPIHSHINESNLC